MIRALERACGMSRRDIVPAIEGLLASRDVVMEEAGRVGSVVSRQAAGGAGLARLHDSPGIAGCRL